MDGHHSLLVTLLPNLQSYQARSQACNRRVCPVFSHPVNQAPFRRLNHPVSQAQHRQHILLICLVHNQVHRPVLNRQHNPAGFPQVNLVCNRPLYLARNRARNPECSPHHVQQISLRHSHPWLRASSRQVRRADSPRSSRHRSRPRSLTDYLVRSPAVSPRRRQVCSLRGSQAAAPPRSPLRLRPRNRPLSRRGARRTSPLVSPPCSRPTSPLRTQLLNRPSSQVRTLLCNQAVLLARSPRRSRRVNPQVSLWWRQPHSQPGNRHHCPAGSPLHSLLPCQPISRHHCLQTSLRVSPVLTLRDSPQ
jgi:hypothetical protein